MAGQCLCGCAAHAIKVLQSPWPFPRDINWSAYGGARFLTRPTASVVRRRRRPYIHIESFSLAHAPLPKHEHTPRGTRQCPRRDHPRLPDVVGARPPGISFLFPHFHLAISRIPRSANPRMSPQRLAIRTNKNAKAQRSDAPSDLLWAGMSGRGPAGGGIPFWR